MWFAVATLGGVVVRMVLSFRENKALLGTVREKAITDALTGLGNRRVVIEDLEHATSPDAGESVFAIFDLDGFKSYNDQFGHPAGDNLLRRLGQRLAAAVAPDGTAYRLGGDEFCTLVPGGEAQVPRVLAVGADALSEQGDGFEITASAGATVLPTPGRRSRRGDADSRSAHVRGEGHPLDLGAQPDS